LDVEEGRDVVGVEVVFPLVRSFVSLIWRVFESRELNREERVQVVDGDWRRCEVEEADEEPSPKTGIDLGTDRSVEAAPREA
jgi:hypothetical protein